MANTMTYSQFIEKFRDDLYHERLEDEYYWETHEFDWQEHLRDEYLEYCRTEGYEVVFD